VESWPKANLSKDMFAMYHPSPPDPRAQIGFNGLKSNPFVPFAVASVRFEQCPVGVVGF
jgi:hypothetical protein